MKYIIDSIGRFIQKWAWIIMLPMLSSCVEDVELVSNRFEKLVSDKLGSFGQVELELENGDIVVGGAIEKPAFPGSGNGFAEATPAISILDPNGILKKRVIYPMEQLNLPEFPGENFATSARGFVMDMIPIDGSRYVALISLSIFDLEGFPVSILAFLDSEFNLESVISELVFDDYFGDDPRLRLASSLFNYHDAAIGINIWRDLWADCCGQGPSTSMIKMDLSGKIINYQRFPGFRPPGHIQYQGLSPLIEPSGSIILPATKFDNSVYIDSIIMYRISQDDLSIIDEGSYGGSDEQHFAIAVFPVPEGYMVLKRYDLNPDSEQRNAVQDKLGFTFFDTDLNFIRNVHYEDIVGSLSGKGVQTMDGGVAIVVTEFSSDRGYVLKVDERGNEVWRLPFDGTASSNGAIIETRDGHLLVSLTRLFNKQSEKLVIMKIGPNGEFY